MIVGQVETYCIECGDNHAMLVSPPVEEPFDGQCPECDEMTRHELVEVDDD